VRNLDAVVLVHSHQAALRGNQSRSAQIQIRVLLLRPAAIRAASAQSVMPEESGIRDAFILAHAAGLYSLIRVEDISCVLHGGYEASRDFGIEKR
jgi:hypothetical protein